MDNLIHSLLGLRDLPYGSVVIDREGDAWQKLYDYERWGLAGFDAEDPYFYIGEFLPVTVVYTPDED